jgi:predicted ATPase/DNA-binding CsgD family transcriptional regulator
MSATPTSPLPSTFTTLVGRAHEIDAIAVQLRNASGSIVTLVGPSGVGKTRLAIAVAQHMSAEFALGSIYVDLSALTEADQVVPAIVAALGLAETEAAPGQLAGYLSDRSLLLVVDNFEQVLDAGPMVNACVAGAPGVRTLVTSQAPLRVRGEQEYAVEPLAVPPVVTAREAGTIDLNAMAEIPAVQLFVARAQVVRPGFQLTESNLPAVVAVCRYLDGLPLAIELAAARSNVLSPEALLNRLTTSLQLLSGGPRDAPNRHQGLRAAIEWSYGLLSPQEALLLDRLSVFSGSFSLAASEAIAGNAPIRFAPSMYVDAGEPLADDDGRLDWSEVFELLDGLVDHSLVQRVESQGEEPRFRLFQTIRQLAAGKLAERGDAERTALRHATWFHAMAESAWLETGVPKLEQHWLDTLDRDYENLRAALDYVTETDPAIGSTFAAALVWFYYIRGRRMEGIRAMQRPIGQFDRSLQRPEAQARSDFALGNLLVLFPQTKQEGIGYLERVLDDLRALGHDWGAGYTLLSLAVLAEDDGRYQQALDFIEEGRPLLLEVNDAPTLANVEFHRAVNYFGLGELDRARALVTPVAEAAMEQAGLNIAYARHLLGMIELAEGNRRTAARSFIESLDFSMHYGVVGTATELIDAAATLLEPSGDSELVVQLFGAADRHNRETGNPITLPELSYYEAARGRSRDALSVTRYNELLAAGAAMSLEASFALARETLISIEAGMPLVAAQGVQARTPFGLTARELEVMRLVALGLSDREIGDELFISHATARTHVRNILVKLEVHSRAAATTIALRDRIVSITGTD